MPLAKATTGADVADVAAGEAAPGRRTKADDGNVVVEAKSASSASMTLVLSRRRDRPMA